MNRGEQGVMGKYTAATLLSLALLFVMPRYHSGALSMHHGSVGKPVGAFSSHRAHARAPTSPPHQQITNDICHLPHDVNL